MLNEKQTNEKQMNKQKLQCIINSLVKTSGNYLLLLLDFTLLSDAAVMLDQALKLLAVEKTEGRRGRTELLDSSLCKGPV